MIEIRIVFIIDSIFFESVNLINIYGYKID